MKNKIIIHLRKIKQITMYITIIVGVTVLLYIYRKILSKTKVVSTFIKYIYKYFVEVACVLLQ